MKAAAFSHAIELNKEFVNQVLLHTGQHYSHEMSGRLQEELRLPKVDIQLQVDADPCLRMGQMMKGVCDALDTVRPDAIVVFGDTDSTLAAALAASKAHVPVVHIEAGLRSFDRRMPEEHNRILTDQLSDVLFCPSQSAVDQLAKEGIVTAKRPGLRVEAVGDLMLDTARFFGGIPAEKGIEKSHSVLLTLHRPSNVDHRETLIGWIEAIAKHAKIHGLRVLFPVHPRTQKGLIEEWGEGWRKTLLDKNIDAREPAGYLQILEWLKEVDEVWTDSGGLQKEAFFMKRPALVLRESTEWNELIEGGFAALCAESSQLDTAHSTLRQSAANANYDQPIYGDGRAAHHMVNSLIQWLNH